MRSRYAARVNQLLEFTLVVKATNVEMQRRFNEVLRPLGVTAGQAEAISVIGRSAPLSLRELGELLVAETGHPSRLVERLVDAGLVVRRESGTDRRQVELTLSPRGRRLLARITRAQAPLLEWGCRTLSGQNVKAATAAMLALLEDGPLAATVTRRAAL